LNKKARLTFGPAGFFYATITLVVMVFAAIRDVLKGLDDRKKQ